MSRPIENPRRNEKRPQFVRDQPRGRKVVPVLAGSTVLAVTFLLDLGLNATRANPGSGVSGFPSRADEIDSQGQTIFMVTHNPDNAALTHRILRIQDGRIHA